MSKRLRYVDVARGVTILCVILGHMEVGKKIRTLIFSFHMPLFFLLSGYFQTKRSMIDFGKNKGYSLMIPYLFTGICVIFGTQLENMVKFFSHRGTVRSVKYLLTEWIKAIVLGSGSRQDVLWIHADFCIGAIWFLLALFGSQLLVNLFAEKKMGFVYIAGIAFLGIISARYFWLPLSMQASAAASVYVAIGYAYKHQIGLGGDT